MKTMTRRRVVQEDNGDATSEHQCRPDEREEPRVLPSGERRVGFDVSVGRRTTQHSCVVSTIHVITVSAAYGWLACR